MNGVFRACGHPARLLAAALAGLAIGSAHGQPQAAGDAARVNGVPISVERLELSFEEHLREQRVNIGAVRNPARVKRLKRETLDILIDQELLWQEAQLSGVAVTSAEIEAAVVQVRSGFGSDAAFAERLRSQGYTPASYAERLRRLVGANKVLARAEAGISVGDDEISAFYASHAREFTRPEQARLRHLYLRLDATADEPTRAAARERMRQIVGALRAGRPFEALAREHSQGGSAPSGGDIGYVQRSELVEPLARAAFALRAGEVSEPVELADGLHLLRCDEYLPAVTEPLAALTQRIGTHLRQQKVAEVRRQTLQRLRERARIEILVPLPPVDAAAEEATSPVRRSRQLMPGARNPADAAPLR